MYLSIYRRVGASRNASRVGDYMHLAGPVFRLGCSLGGARRSGQSRFQPELALVCVFLFLGLCCLGLTHDGGAASVVTWRSWGGGLARTRAS